MRAGSANVAVAADARVRPTNPTTPRRRADTRARTRTSTWYRRRITITASTATSTGAPLAYRSTRPDCVLAIMIPPMAAAAAVTSTITRVTHGRRRRCPWARRAARRRRGSRCGRAVAQPVPAVAARCVLAITIPPIAAAAAVTSTITRVTHGRRRRCPWARRAARRRRGRRCGRAVAQPVPAVAMTSAARPGHQAAGPGGAAFGISSTASAQAIAAAGTQGSAAPTEPEPEQLPQRRSPRAQQGEFGHPAGGDHPGRQQQHHRARDRQAHVDHEQHEVHRVRFLDQDNQRLEQAGGHLEVVRHRRHVPGQLRIAVGDVVDLVVQGRGLAAQAGRVHRELPLHDEPGLAEDLLYRPELAGIGDDRANPERTSGGVGQGRPWQQRIGLPEQGIGVDGRDDPGHVEVDLVERTRIDVRGDADRHQRAWLELERAGHRLGDHDLDGQAGLRCGGQGGRHGAGHQPHVAGQRVAVGHLQLRGDPFEDGKRGDVVRLGGQRRPVRRLRAQGERAAAEIAAQLAGDGGEVGRGQFHPAPAPAAQAAEGGVDHGPVGRGDYALIER